MIVTVTLNPALDLTYTVDALIPHATHRVTSVKARPGGKGLNVAAVLHALGEPVLATGILGGGVGAQITDLLREAGLPASFVVAPIESRRTVTVADRADATGFWEPGPHIPPPSWPAFVDHFRSLLPQASVVALCGSLPPGIPLDAYAELTLLAADHGVPVILDTSGPALRLGLAARPQIAKPNAAELAALLVPPATDSPSTRHNEVAGHASSPRPDGNAARDTDSARDSGPAHDSDHPGSSWREQAERVLVLGARAVVISRGPQGLLAVTDDGGWAATPPEALPGNPTGAGDACVAALARGLRDHTPWPEVLAEAVALAGATVAAPVAGRFDPATYQRLRAATEVAALPPP